MSNDSENRDEQRMQSATRTILMGIRSLEERVRREHRISGLEFREVLQRYYGRTSLDEAQSKLNEGVDGLTQVARDVARASRNPPTGNEK